MELERARQTGLQGLTVEDRNYLLEWYMSRDFSTRENEEPDADLVAEWKEDRRYEIQEYYRMAI